MGQQGTDETEEEEGGIKPPPLEPGHARVLADKTVKNDRQTAHESPTLAVDHQHEAQRG
jgi:hypothetical protein